MDNSKQQDVLEMNNEIGLLLFSIMCSVNYPSGMSFL